MKVKNWLMLGTQGMLFSVSNPVYTDTGIPVFGTPNTNTGRNMPVFAGIEKEQKWTLLTKVTTF
jgi:hypothetical protein